MAEIGPASSAVIAGDFGSEATLLHRTLCPGCAFCALTRPSGQDAGTAIEKTGVRGRLRSMGETKDTLVGQTAQAVAVITKEVPVYQDALQPTVREVGYALHTAGSLVSLAIRPLRSFALAGHELFDRLDEWLQEKLKDTPPEQIVEPPPYVSGPAVFALSMVVDEPDLRDMYVNLIAGGMRKTTRDSVHPAFVDVLRQLTPNEARLLPWFYVNRAMFEIRFRVNDKPGQYRNGPRLIDIGPSCTDAEIDNFERLRLISLAMDARIVGDEHYDRIRTARAQSIAIIEAQAKTSDCTPEFRMGIVQSTAFGSALIDVCLPGLAHP